MRQDLQTCFSNITWERIPGAESRSGSGSSIEYTQKLRASFPVLFRLFNVETFVDAACGDWNWMQHVDLSGVTYIGLDIVEEIIATNRTTYQRSNVTFGVADITSDPLPEGDMLMVRDCLFHLQNDLVWDFFRNFAASNIPFLMTTSYTFPENVDIQSGRFRQLNLHLPPFNFERPISAFEEPKEWWGTYSNRFMGIWSRAQVRDALRRAAHDNT